MASELAELTDDLFHMMQRAISHACDVDFENNFDGDIDDYDGLDDDALDQFIEDLSDDLLSVHCPSSEKYSEQDVLVAMKAFFIDRGDPEDSWEIVTIDRTLQKLSDQENELD